MDETTTSMFTMASSKRNRMHSGEGMQGSSSPSLRQWEELNYNILNRIFDGVLFYHLSRNVSSVCRSWQLACWYRFFWVKNVLDLSLIAPTLGIVYTNQKEKNAKAEASKLMKQLKSIMEGYEGCGFPLKNWRLSIRTVLIPEDMKILDQHLAYIAERTVGLESLKLYGSSKITAGGISKALSNWKNIKSICLGHIKFHDQVIEQIGKNCSSLESLCMYLYGFHLREENAVVIVKCLRQVKNLKFYGACLHRDGINYIISNSHGPEAIQFVDCFLRDNDEVVRICPRTFTLKRRDETWRIDADHFNFLILNWLEINTLQNVLNSC